MSEPFIGEVRPFSFNYAPKGWAQCNGQLLSIAQNQALFSLLGTTYGGDGRTTFALPNLQGRVPINPGTGMPAGSIGGEETHTLTINEIPAHTHQAQGGTGVDVTNPVNNTWGTPIVTPAITAYATTIDTTMNSAALGTSGASAAHPNMQPYTVVNYCIALTGIWPPRN